MVIRCGGGLAVTAVVVMFQSNDDTLNVATADAAAGARDAKRVLGVHGDPPRRKLHNAVKNIACRRSAPLLPVPFGSISVDWALSLHCPNPNLRIPAKPAHQSRDDPPLSPLGKGGNRGVRARRFFRLPIRVLGVEGRRSRLGLVRITH